MYIREGMMKKQSCGVGNASAVGVHKDSQTISKVKPKIRIIHIFAPEIIKTDVANFRELVQRLTGKPTDNGGCIKKRPRLSGGRKLQDPRTSTTCTTTTTTFPLMPMAKKMEMRSGFHHRSSELRERIKGEEDIWRGANSGGGFLGGFTELEGFMEQLNEFPLLPMDAPPPSPPPPPPPHVESSYGQSLQLA